MKNHFVIFLLFSSMKNGKILNSSTFQLILAISTIIINRNPKCIVPQTIENNRFSFFSNNNGISCPIWIKFGQITNFEIGYRME